jgi:hypothetical protein
MQIRQRNRRVGRWKILGKVEEDSDEADGVASERREVRLPEVTVTNSAAAAWRRGGRPRTGRPGEGDQS